jgi:transposase-like protein
MLSLFTLHTEYEHLGVDTYLRHRVAKGGGVVDLDAAFFRDEGAARQKLEAVRWPQGVVCSHCGAVGTSRGIASSPTNRVRAGLYRCRACGRQFTVTVGTVMEASHIPLHLWLRAIHLLFSAERPVRVSRVQRTLGITYKSAWIMVQRLRTAERECRASAHSGRLREKVVEPRATGPRDASETL